MEDRDLVRRYNYERFVPDSFAPWLNFGASPPVGEIGPDFPLWELDGAQTRLSQVWSASDLTIVEFGSFT